MKVYTKKGDKGNTTLVGGNKVTKDSILVEAYGTIDELIAQLGLIEGMNVDEWYKDIIFKIQNILMLCAANVADLREDKTLPDIVEEDVKYLEERIDKMDLEIEPLKNFVLFRGAIPSVLNMSRTVCRRAERATIRSYKTGESNNENVTMVIKYLNRLSDFLFTMARHTCLKYDSANEIPWRI